MQKRRKNALKTIGNHLSEIDMSQINLEGVEQASRKAAENNFKELQSRASKFEDVATVLKIDAEKFLKSTNEKFDLIFLDPPYFGDKYKSVIKELSDSHILADEGLIVVEWDIENGFTDELEGFCIEKEKKYGRVGVTVLRWG